MSCSDWIQLGSLTITFLALVTVWVTAWLLPKRARVREKEDQVDRVKKRVSLYLDVFEIKLKKEIHIIDPNRLPAIRSKSFEGVNQRNYQKLENILHDATVLERDDYMELMEFVRDFKISPPMKYKKDLKAFLARIKNKKLRDVFREGRGLKEAIEKAKQSG